MPAARLILSAQVSVLKVNTVTTPTVSLSALVDPSVVGELFPIALQRLLNDEHLKGARNVSVRC
jgi:hypothetical protein